MQNQGKSQKSKVKSFVFLLPLALEFWYVHFTTYVQEIPLVHTIKNGCLGLDFNKDHISATYVKPDGNIGNFQQLTINNYLSLKRRGLIKRMYPPTPNRDWVRVKELIFFFPLERGRAESCVEVKLRFLVPLVDLSC